MFSNSVGVHWRLNKATFLWLGIFVLAGFVLGLIIVFKPDIEYDSISNSLLDGNLLRVVKPNIGFGSILFGRLFDFALFFTLVFAVCLHRWTVFLVFPLALYRGFEVVINLYWIIAKFGFVTGLVLFLIYLILFLLLLVLILMTVIYCMRSCAEIRRGGFRGGMRWREFFKGACVFLFIALVTAFVEWLLYWLILGKIVFV